MKRLLIFAAILGTTGHPSHRICSMEAGSGPFQQAYNACHENKSCSDEAWANYRAELAAISSKNGFQQAILSPPPGF
jgi:hypothetical protein